MGPKSSSKNKKNSETMGISPKKEKIIGMLGGVSWLSSVYAYETINAEANKRLGGDNSVPICMWSVEFGDIISNLKTENWKAISKPLVDAAKRLEHAGVDFVYMPCNTFHICAPEIEESINIPFIHISDSIGIEAKKTDISKIALLGTKFTMEMDFYKERLSKKFGLEVIIPKEKDRDLIHNVILNELVRNDFREDSRKEFLRILHDMKEQGAEGGILGCTEIGLLIKQKNIPDFPLLDSDLIHSKRALDIALGAEPEIFLKPRQVAALSPCLSPNR